MARNLRLSVWAAFLLALFPGVISEYAFCQEHPPVDFMPREFSAEEAMQNIARLRSPLYESSSLVPILKLQQDVLNLENSVQREILDNLREKSDELNAELQKLDENVDVELTKSEKETGILVDRETTNRLMQNCLVELQRIDWELAAERALPEPKADNAELEVARLDIEARQAELEAIVARLESLQKSANASAKNEDILIEQRAKLRLAETELSKAKLRVDAVASSSSRDAAARVTQLTERRKVLITQLEELKQQRNVWRIVERMKSASSLVQNRVASLSVALSEREVELMRRSVTAEIIEHALQFNEEQEKAEAKPDAGK